MSPPLLTSAEAFKRYVGGQCLLAGDGEAWRSVKAWLLAAPPEVAALSLPAVSEPFLAITLRGEVAFQEREPGGEWLSHRLRKGSFFLTTGGEPYECRWRALSPEPFETMLAFIALPVIERALEEVFGANAAEARLRDISAFEDPPLVSLMERLRDELTLGKNASAMFLDGLAQAIAVHLARNYGELRSSLPHAGPSLPGYKLSRLTAWMEENFAEELDLDRLAELAGLSKFHFQRLFTRAIGMSPSRYQTHLRVNAARRLLRESGASIVTVSLEVGYSNPSHFAQVFRRETGLAPSDYRRER